MCSVSAVEPFKSDTISETILRRLLKQDIIYHIKVKSREKARNEPGTVIYQQGKAVDYFVLILEGRVEVTVGKENLIFESGPFTYFGCQALSPNFAIGELVWNFLGFGAIYRGFEKFFHHVLGKSSDCLFDIFEFYEILVHKVCHFCQFFYDKSRFLNFN